jgi:hypothetical protein
VRTAFLIWELFCAVLLCLLEVNEVVSFLVISGMHFGPGDRCCYAFLCDATATEVGVTSHLVQPYQHVQAQTATMQVIPTP